MVELRLRDMRDMFAAHCMNGIVSSIVSDTEYLRLWNVANSCNLTLSQWIARDAYKQADAMMAAREPATSGDNITE